MPELTAPEESEILTNYMVESGIGDDEDKGEGVQPTFDTGDLF